MPMAHRRNHSLTGREISANLKRAMVVGQLKSSAPGQALDSSESQSFSFLPNNRGAQATLLLIGNVAYHTPTQKIDQTGAIAEQNVRNARNGLAT
jgi:hypothetical protein